MKSPLVIYSPKHTKPRDPYVTFWRPDCKGYAWPIPWVGLYDEQTAKSNACEDALVVPLWAVLPLVTQPRAGDIDGDVGPVVKNTPKNRRALRDAALTFDETPAPALHESEEVVG